MLATFEIKSTLDPSGIGSSKPLTFVAENIIAIEPVKDGTRLHIGAGELDFFFVSTPYERVLHLLDDDSYRQVRRRQAHYAIAERHWLWTNDFMQDVTRMGKWLTATMLGISVIGLIMLGLLAWGIVR